MTLTLLVLIICSAYRVLANEEGPRPDVGKNISLASSVNAANAASLIDTTDDLMVGQIQDGSASISVCKPDANNLTATYRLSPKVRVIVNGHLGSLSELHSGDQVHLECENGLVSRINVVRLVRGLFIGTSNNELCLTPDYVARVRVALPLHHSVKVTINNETTGLSSLRNGDQISVLLDENGFAADISALREAPLRQLWDNFRKNLFKPLLLFFIVGFSIPLLRIAFEFPYAVYQGLTIYLLIAIGWHGGEELAVLSPQMFRQASSFMWVGFFTNCLIGLLAYFLLRWLVPMMRRVDSATVAAYYGSDSAGTFLTCLGALQSAHIAFAPYMPVMLAIMEIPGCLIGLYLVSSLRKQGMDRNGYMPGENGYGQTCPLLPATLVEGGFDPDAKNDERLMALENISQEEQGDAPVNKSASLLAIIREVFLNPGLFLLLSGIIIGFISRLQGSKVVEMDDALFVTLFQGLLCLFLLEMGMTAAKRLRDLKTASWRFIAFGLLAPNLFACIGIGAAHLFAAVSGQPLQLGTYVLFAVLCGAASYIAVPAIQRLAIPESSPTLPLAASLGLTFVYNVTLGIPLYLFIAQRLLETFPLVH